MILSEFSLVVLNAIFPCQKQILMLAMLLLFPIELCSDTLCKLTTAAVFLLRESIFGFRIGMLLIDIKWGRLHTCWTMVFAGPLLQNKSYFCQYINQFAFSFYFTLSMAVIPISCLFFSCIHCVSSFCCELHTQDIGFEAIQYDIVTFKLPLMLQQQLVVCTHVHCETTKPLAPG